MGLKLDEIIANVNKTEKESIITKGLAEYEYERIPFTSPRMNYMTYGGIPVGKITEFYGEEHGGKTTTALDVVANFQNMFPDRDVLYVDAENTLDSEWARKIGVNVDSMYILQPQSQSAEDIFKIIEDSVSTGEVGLWVLDSIGVLVSEAELDDKKNYEDRVYGGISLPLTRFSKKIEMLMKKHACTGIGINQLREKMNSSWGGTDTPGGKAWKHCCAVRIEFSRGSFYDEKGANLSRNSGEPAGNYVIANCKKNKTAPPTRHVGQYRIRYDIGIDYLADLVDVAIMYDIVDQRGAWFNIVNTDTGEVIKDKIQGQANLYKLLDESPDITEQIEQLVDKAIQ